MITSTYVGPFLIVDRQFFCEWSNWERIVADGRREAAEEGEPLHLVPNVLVPGIDRQMWFERGNELPVISLDAGAIETETQAFRVLVKRLLEHLRDRGIAVQMQWGIVTCYG